MLPHSLLSESTRTLLPHDTYEGMLLWRLNAVRPSPGSRSDGAMSHKVWPPNGHLSEVDSAALPGRLPGLTSSTWGLGRRLGQHDLAAGEEVPLDRPELEPNPYYRPFLDANRAFVRCARVAKEPQAEARFYVHLDNPEAFSALRLTK